MISIFGHIFLLLGMSASIFTIFSKNYIRPIFFLISALTPLICVFILITAFLTSDFTVKNVFLNSSLELPLIYKIAASWSSHEGSMLLWYGFLGAANYIYIRFAADFSSPNFTPSAKNYGIKICAFIHILFASFIIFTSNPFETFSFLPGSGLGLNPMLQDIALSIHPPILYLGNICFAPIFVGTMILLSYPQEKEPILALNRIFLNIALGLLTLGIGLGARWAYRELGWGGYWFFDPVENISVLPWISGIALHHFLIIYHGKKLFLNRVIFLSLFSFLLILYGTFIVRSGIITSVHSFAFSPQRGLFIFLICFILNIFAFTKYFRARKNFPSFPQTESLKDSLILLGNIFWLIALGALIIALIYPIYCYLILETDIVIDPEYFYKVFIPILIPIIFLASITPNINKKYLLRTTIIFVISSIFFIILRSKIELNVISQIICLVSVILISKTFDGFLVESEYFSKNIGLRRISLFLGHGGFGLLALAVTLNCALAREVEFIGKIGDMIDKEGLKVRLEDIKFAESNNYYRQIADFKIENQDGTIVHLKPENRLYKVENSLSQEVDIFSFIFYDLYAVISRVDKTNIHAKIYFQPFISFIWSAISIISLSFFLLLWSKKKL